MIELKYGITPAEHLEMIKAVRFPLKRRLVRLLLWVVCMTISAWAYEDVGETWGVMFVFFMAMAILDFAMPYILSRRVYGRNPRLFGERKVTIDEEGLKSESAIGKVEINWKNFERLQETKNLFLTFQTKDVIGILPKRAIGGKTDVDQLREFLKSKIPARV